MSATGSSTSESSDGRRLAAPLVYREPSARFDHRAASADDVLDGDEPTGVGEASENEVG